jgi:hypothetical protein
MGGAGSTNRGEEESVGKPEGRRTLGRSRPRRVDLGQIGWGGMEWIDRAQDKNRWRALVNSVMKLPVP